MGARVLSCLLESFEQAEIWCGVHERDVPLKHPALRSLKLNLEGEFDLNEIPAPLDLVVHFAGLTHAQDEERYLEVNTRGTERLAESARERGCRRFVYISTRCATEGSGAYGESKREAELALQKLDWEQLLIIRPSEVYGGGGSEGVDKFIQLARRYHVVPLLWGDRDLQFAPLRVDDFTAGVCRLIKEGQAGVRVVELCGPENLSGPQLSLRIARRYKALPLPLWWPGLKLLLKALQSFGFYPVTPDQLERLTGPKTASASSPEAIADRPMTRFMRD